MTDVKIEIDDIFQGEIYFNWGGQGIGFGQLSVSKQAGKFICNNECMSRQQVRELLIAYANKLADIVELEDENESTKGFEKIPPFVKGVLYIKKPFSVLKEGMVVEHKGAYVVNPYNGELISLEEGIGCFLDIRGYKTKEELLAQTREKFVAGTS